MQKACLQVLFQKVKNKENHFLSVSGGFNLGHCQKHVRFSFISIFLVKKRYNQNSWMLFAKVSILIIWLNNFYEINFKHVNLMQ